MKNISMQKLMQMRVPLPQFEYQKRFETAVDEVVLIQRAGWTEIEQLTSSLLAHAFTGALTAEWRENFRQRLAPEIAARDAALKAKGATSARVSTIQEFSRIFDIPDNGIYADLSRQQRELIRWMENSRSGKALPETFSIQTVAEQDGCPIHNQPDAIRRHLDVFAARGLLVSHSVEVPESTGRPRWKRAYSFPAQSDEDPRLALLRAMAADSNRREQ